MLNNMACGYVRVLNNMGICVCACGYVRVLTHSKGKAAPSEELKAKHDLRIQKLYAQFMLSFFLTTLLHLLKARSNYRAIESRDV